MIIKATCIFFLKIFFLLNTRCFVQGIIQHLISTNPTRWHVVIRFCSNEIYFVQTKVCLFSHALSIWHVQILCCSNEITFRLTYNVFVWTCGKCCFVWTKPNSFKRNLFVINFFNVLISFFTSFEYNACDLPYLTYHCSWHVFYLSFNKTPCFISVCFHSSRVKV